MIFYKFSNKALYGTIKERLSEILRAIGSLPEYKVIRVIDFLIDKNAP